MIDPESMKALQRELRERMVADRSLLDTLREELRSGLGEIRRIMPRQTTAISLVGTDGGNNRVEFDPFMAQLIRVVDSSNGVQARYIARYRHMACIATPPKTPGSA